jgi:CheY-like chemotaxis protein
VQHVIDWKMKAASAANGVDALAILRNASESGWLFDVAIIDMRMPAIDGPELARAVGGAVALAQLKMVMLTSIDGMGKTQRARGAGVQFCLAESVPRAASAPLAGMEEGLNRVVSALTRERTAA